MKLNANSASCSAQSGFWFCAFCMKTGLLTSFVICTYVGVHGDTLHRIMDPVWVSMMPTFSSRKPLGAKQSGGSLRLKMMVKKLDKTRRTFTNRKTIENQIQTGIWQERVMKSVCMGRPGIQCGIKVGQENDGVESDICQNGYHAACQEVGFQAYMHCKILRCVSLDMWRMQTHNQD